MKKISVVFAISAICFAFSNGVLAQDKNKAGNNSLGSSYKTGIGLRGGWTSGLTIKHFISNKAAIEGIIGSRWRGLSLAGLLELHKHNVFDVDNLALEYGIGARLGFYNEYYYYGWNNRTGYEYRSKRVTTIGLIGILGLEYKFEEVPLSVSADILPYFDFYNGGDGFLDGSLSIRYVF